jgi:hypothetical protein
MTSQPHSTAEHHYRQAEQMLATLGSISASPVDATREASVALVHAVLAIAAGKQPPADDQPAFARDY